MYHDEVKVGGERVTSISSSVARNDATSRVGSFWTKPTVSVSNGEPPLGSAILREVGSSVAKSLSSA